MRLSDNTNLIADLFDVMNVFPVLLRNHDFPQARRFFYGKSGYSIILKKYKIFSPGAVKSILNGNH